MSGPRIRIRALIGLVAVVALGLAIVHELPLLQEYRRRAAQHAAKVAFLKQIAGELKRHEAQGTLDTNHFGFSEGDRDRFWTITLSGADSNIAATHPPNGGRFAADLARLRTYHEERRRAYDLGSMIPFHRVSPDPPRPRIDGLFRGGDAG